VNPGAGGDAAAVTFARAGTVDATANAIGGAGGKTAGIAAAAVAAAGSAGTFDATAETAPAEDAQLIQSISAGASGAVDGAGIAQARVTIDGAASDFVTGQQGAAFATGAPDRASAAPVLSANARIKAAFGHAPTFFAIGELGGGHSSAGTASQTVTSTINETVDLTKLSSRRDLVAGFYDGTPVGSAITGVTFDLYADGIDLVHRVFSTGAEAKRFFTDDAVDLGSLASGQTLGADTLTLKAVLTVTSSAAGSGFYGDFIVGDPPGAGAKLTPALHGLIQAVAGLGTEPAATATGSGIHIAEADDRLLLAGPTSRHWA